MTTGHALAEAAKEPGPTLDPPQGLVARTQVQLVVHQPAGQLCCLAEVDRLFVHPHNTAIPHSAFRG
jgi:hypothetical protein